MWPFLMLLLASSLFNTVLAPYLTSKVKKQCFPIRLESSFTGLYNKSTHVYLNNSSTWQNKPVTCDFSNCSQISVFGFSFLSCCLLTLCLPPSLSLCTVYSLSSCLFAVFHLIFMQGVCAHKHQLMLAHTHALLALFSGRLFSDWQSIK